MGSGVAEAGTTLRDLAKRLAKEPAFAQVVRALQESRSATVDGAWGSSQALTISALAQSKPKLLVVLLPHAKNIDPLMEDLRTFGGALPIIFPMIEDFSSKEEGHSKPRQEQFGRRLSVLKLLAGPDPPKVVVTTIHALLQPVPSISEIKKSTMVLERAHSIDLEKLLHWLATRGWTRRDMVEGSGEFSLRGGILDVYPHDAIDPIRIELFDDIVESIREFSADSQRSLRELNQIELTAMDEEYSQTESKESNASFVDAVPKGTWFALVEPLELKQEGGQYLARMIDDSALFSVPKTWEAVCRHPTVTISSFPHATVETSCSLQVETIERFAGDVSKLKEELDRVLGPDELFLVCHNEAEIKRLTEILKESTALREDRIQFSVGRLAAGFRWVSAGLAAISDNELFHRTETRRTEPRRRFQSQAIDSFIDLKPGDHVVHLGHGIGIFRGMKMLDKNGQMEEHIAIEFADEVVLYVPASKMDLVQRYVGGSHAGPKLSKVGGVAWESKKKKVQAAVRDMAVDLLEVHANRQAQAGIAYAEDSVWQIEFEEAFPYEETPDQLTAMAEIRKDMEAVKPMERLLCGDVGFGKTELAMRAAFKAIDFGKQVAMLVPTTVLAAQHLRTFRERMAEFPFTIEGVSRFQTRGEQRKILKATSEGKVDILIGTHRLLSADVKFHELGLVIIDEEQRFGVEHKERLKHLRSQIDVLTMTATPIPRTLHSSLLGIRDISNLETPPVDRVAVETRISRFDPTLLRRAILRELNRDGQVFFVHTRVADLKSLAERVQKIVPEARIRIMHGQMAEDDIEDAMLAFIERRADVLMATTIIESGLDIPNANTMIINEGDCYGLADLHQLRGRVGRSKNHAYCYVLVDESKILKPDAQRRLKAVEEFSQLGAGFQIAMRDLEIRGAGNILGPEQSGHIAAVGYELYCQLLDNAVRVLKQQPLRTHLDVTVELPWPAYLPHDYLPGERVRIDAYRRLARVRSVEELGEFRREMEDRAGAIPVVARNLLHVAELRILAQYWQVESIRPNQEGFVVMTFRNIRRADNLTKLRNGEVILADHKSLYVRLPEGVEDADSIFEIVKRVLQPN